MRNKFWIGLISLTLLSAPSCDRIVGKTASKIGKKASKEYVEKAAKETAEKAGKKAAKEVSSKAAEKGAKEIAAKSLKEFASSSAAISGLYDSFTNRISREFADGIVVNTTEKGVEMASRDFPNTAIQMNKSMMIGRAGSLKSSGPMNEFLNHLLPNKTYIVDEVFVYKTDDIGRVITCTADRSKAFKTIERNTQRNSDIQKYIVESLDGRVGFDDGGHLFANSTGGPNELINQIPMSRKLNQTGQWRELERVEEKALKEGKNVVSQRNLLYHGNEKRPYAIEFITKIDGVETKTIVENI